MFLIQPTTFESYLVALNLLEEHDVFHVDYFINHFMGKEVPIEKTILVDGEDGGNAIGLCESAFQMTFRQSSASVCGLCAKAGKDVCGHLTFTDVK